MNKKTLLTVALLTGGALAAARTSVPRGETAASPAALVTTYDLRQTLIDGQMASEAALTAEERMAVAVIRADYRLDAIQQGVAIGAIRRDYRARTETMTALHASERKL